MSFRGAWLFATATVAIACSSAPAQTVYDNTTNLSGAMVSLGGNQWADDLHMTQSKVINEIVFGYDANGSGMGNGATAATIGIYANDATNSIWPGGGAPLIDKFTVPLSPQSSGLYTLLLDPADAIQVAKNAWISISFNHFAGSVLLADPPTIGSSFDVLVRSTSSSTWNGSGPASYLPAGSNNFAVRLGFLEAPAPGAAASLLGASFMLGGARPRRRR